MGLRKKLNGTIINDIVISDNRTVVSYEHYKQFFRGVIVQTYTNHNYTSPITLKQYEIEFEQYFNTSPSMIVIYTNKLYGI